MVKQLGLRVTRSGLQITCLFATAILVAGLAIGGMRLTHNEDRAACLEFVNDVRWLIDPHTGALAPDTRSNLWQVVQHSEQARSPDGRYVAYIYRSAIPGQTFQLFLGPQGSQALTLLRGGETANTVFWSHNSQYMAYLWMAPADRVYVTYVRADGSEPHTVDLGEDVPYHAMNFLGWSPDDTYWAITFQRRNMQTEPTSNVMVRFISVDGNNNSDFETPFDIGILPNWWSEQGHQVALTGIAYDHSFLSVVSPDRIKNIPLNLASGDVIDAIKWSLDGKFLMLKYASYSLPQGESDHIRIFDNRDATLRQLAEVSPTREHLVVLNNWEWAWWSVDDATALFMQAASTDVSSATGADLVAYHIAGDRTEVIASGVYPELLRVVDTPDSTRVVVTWQETGGHWNVDLMDADGKNRTNVYHGLAIAASIKVSPDRHFVAILFRGGGNPLPIIWAQTDGETGPQTNSEDADQALRGADWTESGRWLVYQADTAAIGVTMAARTVVVEPQPGQVYRLSGMRVGGSVANGSLVSEIDPLPVFRFGSDGKVEMAEYTLDGRQLRFFTSLSTQIREQDYFIAAPDRRTVILGMTPLEAKPVGKYSLQLAWSDGRVPLVIAPDVVEVKLITWSPDSSMVAVEYFDHSGSLSVRVLSADGGDLWRRDRLQYVAMDSFEWVPCK